MELNETNLGICEEKIRVFERKNVSCNIFLNKSILNLYVVFLICAKSNYMG